MQGKFDPMISSLENSLVTVKGEIYNFLSGTKKSALNARKALLSISKIAKQMRDEIQAVKTALPIRRRTKKAVVQQG